LISECERLNQQLDELTTTFESERRDDESCEDVILRSNAESAGTRLLNRIELLENGLALERPVSARDTLIFALRALAPLQDVVMAISEEHSYERKQGCIALLLLQGIVLALENLAGATRPEPGFEQPQTETEVIEKLKHVLAQKAINPAEDLG